jgi:hypothetical protein
MPPSLSYSAYDYDGFARAQACQILFPIPNFVTLRSAWSTQQLPPPSPSSSLRASPLAATAGSLEHRGIRQSVTIYRSFSEPLLKKVLPLFSGTIFTA